MAIPQQSLDLIKEFEGYLKQIGDGRVKPYLCPARVWTIGWGSIKHPDGRPVRPTDPPIDRDTAEYYLAHEIETICEPAVDRLITAIIHELMRGSIVSFTFNCGTGALSKSTLLKRINAKRWDDVPKEFMKWRMGGGRVLPGLVRRRAAEAAMFMAGVRAMQNGDLGKSLPKSKTQTTQSAPSWWRSLLRIVWRT